MIKKNKNQPEVPEIIITGYAEEGFKATQEMHLPAVIFKPFDLDQFLSLVREAL